MTLSFILRPAIVLLLAIAPHCASAQTTFAEPPNPVATDSAAWQQMHQPCIAWGSTDVRYAIEMPARLSAKSLQLSAWRGERTSALAVISTPTALDSVTLRWESKAPLSVTPSFVRYVITDGLSPDGKGGCGHRNSADYDSSLVADIIDTPTRVLALAPMTTRPCWVSIDVPRDTPAGRYSGHLVVSSKGRDMACLALTVSVKQRTLPPPAEWTFHLDLWQNPYAVARYHGVEPFSDEHLALMRPVMQRYAEAGGKVITASITHKPWNGQTYDHFESMVTWLRRADGSWLYDFTAFDRWVEFMMSVGVTQQINCYSMVPWRLSFQYYDQASGTLRFIACRPGDDTYAELWGSMLTQFARHLKAKGWFDITHIAMDERSLPDMLATLQVIRRADPHFRVSLAGSYHAALASQLDDYCITLSEEFPADTLRARHEAGCISTFYTCCQERQPNTFTFSPPAEAEWLAWHAASCHLDGYLRWAFNSWVRDPLHDSRFTAWPAGDTYLVYPHGLTSVRMERLREGIQQYEKIRLLRTTLQGKQLRRLENALRPFATPMPQNIAADIKAAKRLLNE